MKQKHLEQDGKRIALTPKEMALLELLLRYRGELVNYHMIENEIWGEPVPMDKVKSLVRYLRKKVGSEVIEDISRMGYILRQQEVNSPQEG